MCRLQAFLPVCRNHFLTLGAEQRGFYRATHLYNDLVQHFKYAEMIYGHLICSFRPDDSSEMKLGVCLSTLSLPQVNILQANGLPRHLSNFVFCQYHFWGQEEPVFIAPEMTPSSSSSVSKDPQCTVVFDSAKVTLPAATEPDHLTASSLGILHILTPALLTSQELSVPVSEEFVEFLADGAVAIEVYGHKQANHRRNLALWDLGVIQAKTRSLRERCREVIETDSKTTRDRQKV